MICFIVYVYVPKFLDLKTGQTSVLISVGLMIILCTVCTHTSIIFEYTECQIIRSDCTIYFSLLFSLYNEPVFLEDTHWTCIQKMITDLD